MLEYIEEIFLGKVCRWASVEALGDIEATTLILPSDDAHGAIGALGFGMARLGRR